MTEPNPRAVIGGNQPPAVDPDILAEAHRRVAEFSAAADEWVKKGDIASEEDASLLADFINGARGVRSAVQEAHGKAKEPHLTASKAVDAAFAPLGLAIAASLSSTQKILTAYMSKKRAAAMAAQAEQRRRADAARKAAEEAAAAAQRRGDTLGAAKAQAAATAAQQALKSASGPVKVQVQSATGGGSTIALRQDKIVTIRNAMLAFRHYQRHPDVLEALRKVAAAEVWSKDWNGEPPPGCDVTIEEKAV